MFIVNRKDNLIFKYNDFIFRYDYFDDFKQFCRHAEPLEIEGYQLSGGNFEGYVAQIITNRVQLDIAQRNCLMRTNGISSTSWAFGIPVKKNFRIIYERVHCLEENYIAINPIHAEFSFFQVPYTAWFIINFSDENIHHFCQDLHLPDPERFIGYCHHYSPVIEISSEKARSLRQWCHYLFNTAFDLSFQRQKKASVSATFIKQKLEEEVAEPFLLAIAEGKQVTPSTVIEKRSSILKQAEEFMLENLKADVQIKDIRQAVGVSQRTLEYIFKDFYQMSPKAYYKLLRLNNLRECLLQSPPEVKLSAIAAEHGFMHRGQLAGDYKKYFGELPSKALKKST